jgi:hypothetical protein
MPSPSSSGSWFFNSLHHSSLLFILLACTLAWVSTTVSALVVMCLCLCVCVCVQGCIYLCLNGRMYVVNPLSLSLYRYGCMAKQLAHERAFASMQYVVVCVCVYMCKYVCICMHGTVHMAHYYWRSEWGAQ